ncbi:excinuclease ABC subunit UvrC [Sphingorhabdus sp. YGSMI21]|uniref:excinuclease ABC subunit UvrC n=1 Tax=Sphingorhabdus sp. YGSMI21 TaxID=2077182 RepID=UPI000C1EFE8F|nr:excinuclease ABC subunit UvrC [Sphingorhabdus sp. YGSMI21]ATW05083.1 excinuclease ABC subunit C [Sphingorhabdus sp. YGSMI21]
MSKADRPDHPNAASRFNEDKATYAVRGEGDTPDLEAGMAAIREVLNTLPTRPGVYRMQDRRGDVLYVGKARSLKARVGAYVQMNRLPQRLMRMVAQTRSMTIVTTGSEAEALLLEAQLIKKFRPAYNVLLRDDKSFPFILLRDDHDFPRITKHRGAQRAKGQYFGPFASAGSVNRTINALQKLFLLRSCTDSFFNNRSRPCLLYQIKRCSAPCVDRVSKEDYAELVKDARDFLSGKSTEVQQKLGGAMEKASESLDFEMAAVYRDRLRALTFIQGSQAINAAGLPDADIFALAAKGSTVCIQAFFIRGGQNWGHRSFFPAHTTNVEIEEVFSSFLMQFYDQMPPPKLVLLDRELPDAELLAEALGTRADYKVSVSKPQRGDRRKLLEQASRNAEEALDRRLAETSTQAKIMREMVDLLELEAVPDRIEIYDNSHIQGTNMVGGMVVAGPEGFRKNAYRKFNIKNPDIAPGDDFAMMREVLERRFSRAQKEDPDRDKGEWPDLVLIDGGKGQMSAARQALAEIGVEDVVMIGVSKGPDRNAGRETFHLPDGRQINLPMNSPVLFYLQRLRDEAHRFAIGAHRTRRAKSVGHSSLDDVPGIGPARKKALLLHFGTARAVKNASLDDLQGAPGVSATVAQKIYDYFHG